MTTPEQERARLAGVYSGMSDGELEKIAAAAHELGEVAQEALAAEITRRDLNLEIAPAPSADVYELRNTITVRKFRDLPEALLAKGSLESAGIEAFLLDDNMIRMDWFISNLLGGIKLQVHPEDVGAATEILDQPTPENLEVDGVGDYQQPKCPNCRSLDIADQELNKLVAYGSAYFGVPIPLQKETWTCHACGHEWKEPSAESPVDPPPSS